MKRIALLGITIFTLSVNSFAQIRIEKRHHNRGWYISTPGHKKSVKQEKVSTKSFSPMQETTEASTVQTQKSTVDSTTSSVNAIVAQPDFFATAAQGHSKKSLVQSTQSKKSAAAINQRKSAKSTAKIPPVKQVIPAVISFSSDKISRSANELKETVQTRENSIKQAQPDESMWSFLFDVFAEGLKFIGILLLIGLAVFLILCAIGLV